MLIDKDYNRLALRGNIRMGGSREVPVAPFEAFLLSEEINHLPVHIASVVVAQVEYQRILVESFRVHCQQEVVEVAVTHSTHMVVCNAPLAFIIDH